MSAISSGWLKTWKSLKIENFGTTIRDQAKLGPNSPYLVPFQTKLGPNSPYLVPFQTKLGPNSPYLVPFQTCVRSRLLSKMAVTTDYTTFDFSALFKVFEVRFN